MTIYTQILILIGLIIVSALSAMAEASLLSVSKYKVRLWIEKKKFGAIYVKRLKDEPVMLLSTVLITNNVVNTAAAVITTSITIGYFQNNALGIATGIAAFVILVFGDIVPKSIGANNNEAISPIIAPVVWHFSVLIYPLIKLLDYLVKAISILIGAKKSPSFTKEELKSIVRYSEEEGSIKPVEKRLIQRIFDFGNTTVADVMTRKKIMMMVESEMKIRDVLKLSSTKLYSRFPVYEKNRDSIVGILYLKDALHQAKDDKLDVPVKDIMKKPFFVFENKRLDFMLRLFQARKEHMAVVINNKAQVVGLVTIENILEEIVGEIVDESDRINPSVMQITKNEWDAKGTAEIDDLNSKTGMSIRESDYDSLDSFASSTLGRPPKAGDEIHYQNFKIIIEEVQGKKVLKAKIVKSTLAK
ncbi:HlyC/CorC family transporter [Candidatus Woesearchaeota archaeon]|nr:HlyC/CorC family transporter [Candidatus Woesearchaeota archaeon]